MAIAVDLTIAVAGSPIPAFIFPITQTKAAEVAGGRCFPSFGLIVFAVVLFTPIAHGNKYEGQNAAKHWESSTITHLVRNKPTGTNDSFLLPRTSHTRSLPICFSRQ